MEAKRRLVTRSDFDGLACAMMLRDLDLVDEIKFVHPKDVQDGKIELTKSDITTNLPYDPRVGLAFDHHESEMDRLKAIETGGKLIIDPNARSAARVVYDYYGGKKTFKKISDELMAAVDKGDSADFTIDEILNPKGWVLLHYLMDARTGLGRFHQFRISNYDLMMELIQYCMDHTIDEILELPDVKERVDLYFEQSEQFVAQLKRIAKVYDKVVVLDLRNEEVIHAGNRFMIYALYPETQISVHVAWGFRKQNTAVMIGKSIVNKASNVDIGELCLKYGGGGHGKSIVNKASNVDIGELCLKYGGGGHHNAGTCQLDNDEVDKQLPDIIAALNA